MSTQTIADREIIEDLSLAIADFGEVKTGPTVQAYEHMMSAVGHYVEMCREEERQSAYWKKKVNDCVSWSKIKDSGLRHRAAFLVVGDFEDVDTAIDFLSCPPLGWRVLADLSSGGRSPRNAYEVFASTLHGGLAREMAVAEDHGPVERFTYRLRKLRGLGESRSKIYQWRKLQCGFRLLNKQAPTCIETKQVGTLPMPAPVLKAFFPSQIEHHLDVRLGHVRDGPTPVLRKFANK